MTSLGGGFVGTGVPLVRKNAVTVEIPSMQPTMKKMAASVYSHHVSGRCGKPSQLSSGDAERTKTEIMPKKIMAAIGVTIALRLISPVTTLFMPSAHLSHRLIRVYRSTVSVLS